MINSKYTSLLSSLTAIFTLAFASGVRAALISAPIPTATYQSTDPNNPPPAVLDDLNTTENAASFISQIYVNGVDSNPDISTVYNVCFEYGQYVNVFNPNRSAANNNLPCVNVSSQTIPEFFGSSTLAALAAGGQDPILANPPMVPIRSSGILTPLNASLMGGANIRRVLANNVFNLGTPEAPPTVDTVNTLAGISFIVPYGIVDISGSNYVAGVFVSYDSMTNKWGFDRMNTSTSVTQEIIFARFGPTGNTVDVHTPSNLELPEPSSAIGGLVLVGAALWLTNRRR